MVKGCQRRIILLRETGSSMFEEAYFILKPERANAPEELMIAEANRIIAEHKRPAASSTHVVRRWPSFLCGLCTGGGLIGLLWLIVL
ncbi:MAG: hypothetical protein IJC15_03535 [Clostridia bacterium]|nr:hypothetical protein [Clostridia bacterium]